LVAITAQEELTLVHRESHQYIDVLKMFDPITKWSARIENPRVTAEVVRKGFKIAQTEKPGPTHLELPSDIAEEETVNRPIPWERARRPSPDRPSLEQAVDLIRRSSAPMILAGNGVIRGDASAVLTRFAEELCIPVALTLMCKGGIPWISPMNLFALARPALDYRGLGLDQADLVICVGYDLVEYDPSHWNPRSDQRIVHIDFTPAEVSSHYVPSVEIVADIRESLLLLRDRISTPKDGRRVSALRESILRELEGGSAFTEGRSDPRRILHELRTALAPEDIVISDVGAHKLWLGRFFPAYQPNTVIISNGLASMGIALPGGLAAAILYPDRHVVTVSGDGGFLMNVQELETACREGCHTTNIVFRDEGLGSIRIKQLAKAGRTFGTEFGNPDLVRLAESFGARGFRASNPSEFASVLREAIDSKIPSVVDVPIDYTESPF
jgi:acetolactate synthase-1/2/3 large subunit